MAYEVQKSDDEWRTILSPETYEILRHAATERPWTGALLEEKRSGLYTCAGCGNELFRSETKFYSGCGWPSFYEEIQKGAVEYLEDLSHGMRRTEIRCAKCGGHLGHIFPDGHGTPTGNRFCMNSLALSFTPDEQ